MIKLRICLPRSQNEASKNLLEPCCFTENDSAKYFSSFLGGNYKLNRN